MPRSLLARILKTGGTVDGGGTAGLSCDPLAPDPEPEQPTNWIHSTAKIIAVLSPRIALRQDFMPFTPHE
jgi:hypothetical protein